MNIKIANTKPRIILSPSEGFILEWSGSKVHVSVSQGGNLVLDGKVDGKIYTPCADTPNNDLTRLILIMD